MSDQEQVKRPAPAPSQAPQDAPKAKASIADGFDDILDEIDAVLETNAEEFVKSYVQKGGQ